MYFTGKFIQFNPLRGELIRKTKVGEPESSWIAYSGFHCVGCIAHCACWYQGPGGLSALKISVLVWKTDPTVQDKIIVCFKKIHSGYFLTHPHTNVGSYPKENTKQQNIVHSINGCPGQV